jgi:hypothetical protein
MMNNAVQEDLKYFHNAQLTASLLLMAMIYAHLDILGVFCMEQIQYL